MQKTEVLWSVPLAVDDVPEGGLHLELEAPASVRAELAKLAGLRDLGKLSAVFDVSRKGAGLHVSGAVSAKIGQTCVVTLEPMENSVEERIDLLFAPAAAGAEAHADQEPPEPLVGGAIDLGALATEFLLLGIDPYPRKPGAEFAPPKGEDAGERPFAALASLKQRLGGGKS
jgi:uncharacterized metal-binding protein YceD (DUF177 family)